MSSETIFFDGKTLDIERAAYLSQHDVVNLSPTPDGYEGFPIGNGDIGAMGWTPADKMCFQINKTNTWDDAPPGIFGGWEDGSNPEKSENFTSLRHCGQLSIEPGLPVFDWMYLEDFEGRLSLHDATASWKAEGPLGTAQVSAIVSHDPPVMAVHYEDQLSEPVERRVSLARWGSRVFEHWYRYVRRDGHLGLDAPQMGCEGDEAWMIQETRSLHFAVACKLVGVSAKAELRNSREVSYRIAPGTECSFDVYISVVTSEEADDPLAAAKEHVHRASEAGRDELVTRHRSWWADFWSQSFVHIGDDYVENLWYMNLYQIGSSSLGEYPPHFIGSIWSWNRDCRPWNHYFQWNQQQYTWPLHTAGHPELMMPYAKWRKESLHGAAHAAKIAHDCEGAFFSDISDRSGNQAVLGDQEIFNLGSTALTGVDILRHYEYTQDDDYLKDYAYPILREIVRFYLGILTKATDGLYHIPNALPNEEFIRCSDTTNDLAGIRKIFPAYIAFSEKLEQDGKYLEISGLSVTGETELRRTALDALHNLAPFQFTRVPDEAKPWTDLKPGDPVIAFGIELDSGLPAHPWGKRPSWAPDSDLSLPSSYHAVNAQIMPIFPANLVSMDDEGTELYEGCRNAARAFDPIGNNGHGPQSICYARLGLADELPEVLDRWVDDYQIFSQGFFCYFMRDYWNKMADGSRDEPYSATEHKVLGLTNDVKVMFSDPEEQTEILRRPFAHMALEAGSVLQATINEMLLQSHDGKIRVFPAAPQEWDCRFTLHAVGAFVVTSERIQGKPAYIAVESLKGRPCRVVNPWGPDEKVFVRVVGFNEPLVESSGATELTFDTDAGQTYIIERESRPLSSYDQATCGGERNMAPKAKRRAVLGIPRRF
jgi:alpha-L-fucosidase 2